MRLLFAPGLSHLLLLASLLSSTVVASGDATAKDGEGSGASSTAKNLYEKSSSKSVQVIESYADFTSTVLESDSIWMIQFYHSNSASAKQLVDVWKTLATMMKGLFAIGAVDLATDSGRRVAEQYKQGSIDVTKAKLHPAILILGDDKKTKPHSKVSLSSAKGKEMETLVQALTNAASQTIQVRFGGPQTRATFDTPPFVELTSENYEEMVLNNPAVVAVAFTAPWCGHCKRLEPEWRQAAAKLARDAGGPEVVLLGWVDATVEEQLASLYGVRGYPTIKVFSGGAVPKSHGDAVDYPGERVATAIVQFMLAEIDRTGAPKEIPELINETILQEACAGANHICVLAALPPILDSGAEGRNKYRNMLSAAAKNFRGSAFSFLWFEGTSQPALEQAMELTFGFPALVAFSMDRQAYAVLRGSFSEKSMTSFLHAITTGRQATVKLRDSVIPKIESVEPWDGLDGAPIEEEFDLSDLFDDGEL
jgi:protein disulfide-isomerase A6